MSPCMSHGGQCIHACHVAVNVYMHVTWCQMSPCMPHGVKCLHTYHTVVNVSTHITWCQLSLLLTVHFFFLCFSRFEPHISLQPVHTELVSDDDAGSSRISAEAPVARRHTRRSKSVSQSTGEATTEEVATTHAMSTRLPRSGLIGRVPGCGHDNCYRLRHLPGW